jgi:hypothetical protein
MNAHQLFENTAGSPAGWQDNANNLCDTKYIAATSTFENNQRAHAQGYHHGRNHEAR